MNFFKSDFFSALFAAAFGALGGAWAAQAASTKSKEREELLKSFHTANSVILLAFDICNSYLGLKKQNIIMITDGYKKQKESFKNVLAQYGGDFAKLPPMNVQLHMFKIVAPKVPIKALLDNTINKINMPSIAMMALLQLQRVLNSFEGHITERNSLINEISSLADHSTKIIIYYGINNNGVHNTYYPDLLRNIELECDDIIFFSKLVTERLMEYTSQLKQQLDSDLRVNKVDFGLAIDAGLIPSEDLYEDWLKGFENIINP